MVTEKVLVDTSAWIEALRVDGDEPTRREVRRVVEEGIAVFSDLVLLELWNGAGGEPEKRYLLSLERNLECLPTTPEVWRRAREMALQCRRAGRTIPATDLLVAACAAEHGAVLLHRDKHFDQIERV
jgi:hypothetical protein